MMQFGIFRKLVAPALILALLGACTRATVLSEPNVDELRADIAYLSAPEMAGRAPGGVAQDAVTGFLIDRMEQAGLTPAFDSQNSANLRGWAQPVTMYQRFPRSFNLQFKRGKKAISQPAGRLALIGIEPNIQIKEARVFFLGRGNADHAAQTDLSNAIVLINAAPNEAERAAREASLSKAGALAVIELARGADPYRILAAEFDHPHFFQPSSDMDTISGMPRASVSGVMGEERAVALVTQSGLDWDKLLLRSSLPGFSGEWLPASADLSVETVIETVNSHNIGGVLKGKKPGSGAVLFVAHWDHLGLCVRRSGLPDIVCPGAVDNASGIAAMLQIAERLAEMDHDRDIYFVATTGEEHGFIGARTLLQDGPAAPTNWVGIFNLDMLAIAPAGTPVAVVGWDGGPVDQTIEKVMAEQGLRRSENPLADSFLKRQDGWVFLSAGLPARMVNSSYGDEWALRGFLANGYHSPADSYKPTIELGGAMQDIRLHIALGHHFASTRLFPLKEP